MAINNDQNNGFRPPAAYSPLALQGHSLQTGLLTCNEGQWSNVSEVLRTQYQARILNNFQMLTRGVWSNPRGIGWTEQREDVFNGGAAFMDFGVFEDFVGNQTLLFQVGDQVYSYDLDTATETAYDAPLTGLSTSLANLPCMRSFVDNTGQSQPLTIYCNGDIQPVKITGTGAADVAALPFIGTPKVSPLNPNGGQFAQTFPINTFTVGTFIANYPVTVPANSEPYACCLGSDGNVWFTMYTAANIGKISPLGVITTYGAPNNNGSSICAGPDGRLWSVYLDFAYTNFTATTTAGVQTVYPLHLAHNGAQQIFTDGSLIYITYNNLKFIEVYTTLGVFVSTTTATNQPTNACMGPDGRVWSTFTGGIQATVIGGATTVYTTGIPAGSSPLGIILGPPGSNLLYFALTSGVTSLGTIDTSGNVTLYTMPENALAAIQLCIGSDGNVWFTSVVVGAAFGPTRVGRFDVNSHAISLFGGPPAGASLHGICTGIDGNIWFCESDFTISAIGTILVGSPSLRGITTGPDDRLWATEFAANKIVATTTTGVITEYLLPNASSGPFDICSDGTDLWFTEQSGNRIGRITTAGAITEYVLPTALSAPSGICLGPGGNMYFTEFNNNKVARITPGGVITEFAVPTASAQPLGICSDGTALWFCESNTNKIAKMTTAGAFTDFNIPTLTSTPSWITLGPDGRLWFTETTGNRIGAITTAGTITEYIIPTASSMPEHITAASDGKLYFVEAAGNNIGQVTVAGVIVEFAITTNDSESFGITDGPDQSIWFTMSGVSQIGNFLYGGSGSWPGVFQLTKKLYSKPRFCTEFNGSMAFFGFDPGSNAALDVLISNKGSVDNFISSVPINATDAISFTIPGLGLPTGCTAFRLTNTNNQEVLILGFQRGIAVVMGNGTVSDATTYQANVLTREYGLMSNRVFDQVQNDMFFLTTNGVRSFSNLTINANLLNAALTFQMQDVIQSITTEIIPGTKVAYNSQAFAVHHRKTLEMQFWYPAQDTDFVSGSYQNQHGIIMNYNVASPSPQAISSVFSTKNGTAIACGIEFGGVMYGGGYDGKLQKHYTGDSYNGQPIPGTLNLSLMNSGNVQQNAELRQGLVIAEGGSQDFNVLTYFYTKMSDGSLARTPSQEGVQQISSFVVGETVLGSTPFVDWTLGYSAFPANHIKQLYFEATGDGPYMEFILTTDGITQALDFAALATTITVGGLRP